MEQYLAIGIFLVGALIFGVIVLIVASFIRPKKPSAEKMTTYECGLDTQGPTWVQFKISYFLYALIFLIFDVETIFLYPWAVEFQKLGLFAFGEMIVFIGILLLGLWYAWKEGALEWL